ncbi:hypothetical protein B6A27_10960 [Anoxybacillus sp. UARK-01]|uniref:DUF342 domain-containing protein n=1 Tax=Anoxybacteroides rupiense TaxID=311460 RepID=A0ABD5IUB3_9BACL|nr:MULTISPECIES: hypothetical protein [Anoxybacillus]MED5051036.1 hypothetical protein [Anoxybacillus rupiensis]OQM45701.1 hypothetical protein B6A27_10960 [Anoxybacillus sp. UARK-01]
MNEKGYSLVLTMLVVTIFFMLGLTILSVSLYQANFTKIRVEDVESLHEATKSIQEAIAEIKVKVENLQLSTPAQLDMDLGNAQAGFIHQVSGRYKVSIQDLTEMKEIDRSKLFTRVYVISKTAGKRTVSRQVIITNTPSFLKYAIGSRQDVTLNGGAYIDGNIYAGRDFYMANVANYIYNSQMYSQLTSFPTTSPTSILFANGNRYVCEQSNSAPACYQPSSTGFTKSELFATNPSLPFQYTSPSVQTEDGEFMDVDFDFTLKDKLLSAAGINAFDPDLTAQAQYQSLIQLPVSRLLSELKNRFTVIHDIQQLPDAINNSNLSILLDGYSSEYLDLSTLELKENQWLIINGNAYLENSGATELTIKGNLIILGNLAVRGVVAFDSTIYVMGNTSIYNATISGINDKEVVLLTKGELEIARINEFQNEFSLTKPNLKGYFYTDSNAILYAVGSYIHIQGGIFARGTSSLIPNTDANGLVINAYRGSTSDTGRNIDFTQPSLPENLQAEQARFVIHHDMNVFIHRGLGLPLVKKLAVIPDQLEVK